jgi:type IV pilus secretin PilQ/predicted competence protein
MSLKQAMRISVLLLALGAVALASTVQLTDVAVQSHDNATTLIIKASGAFTHTAYRPADNLLLVDLSGVTADKLENQTRSLHVPGVESYHVVSYKGANGATTARLEIALSPGAVVQIDPTTNAVMVKVTGKALTASEVAAVSAPSANATEKTVVHTLAEAEKATNRSAIVPKSSKSVAPAQISSIAVSRSKDGLTVDIKANTSITPTAFKLTGPDRIVIDVPNAMPMPHQKTIAVKSNGVENIRIARYSMNPPATRIVVDLDSAKEFSLATNGTHASLHLGTVVTAVALNSVKTNANSAVTLQLATPQAVSAKASDTPSTMAELNFVTKPASPEAVAEFKSVMANGTTSRAPSSAVQDQLPITNSNARMSPQPAMNLAALQQAAVTSAASSNVTPKGNVCGSSSSGEPISVNFKDVDLKDFFRLISDISGLNVVLDPKVSGTIPALVLNDVPWDQALGIVLQNNSLDCQLSGNVLRIASATTLKAEADARKAAQDAQALATETQTITRYISYAVASEMIPTIKSFLTPRGTIVSDTRTNALIITDIPTTMPRVDQLIKQLDQKTQEVEIEVRVVSATRDFSRDLGVQLGFALNNASTTIKGSGAGTADAFPLIPLFSGLGTLTTTSGVGFSNTGANYKMDAILGMAESRSLAKVLSRPRIVTQNNKAATVRQGQQVPVTTPASANTPASTAYIPAFLRLTVTPQITAEGTIFLTVDVEDTTVGATSIGGNPPLNTASATTSVLVTDGSTVVIGGVIATTSTVGYAQVPVLGNIPVLGNLFKSKSVKTHTDELIFFITPRIIQT